ncbi:hypothetical protein EDB19DRAFT_1604575, partial [Suillus lakei]
AISRMLKDAGLTQKLASKHNEVCREEFKASLCNDFIGDGSRFIVINEMSKNDRKYAQHDGQVLNGGYAQLTDVFFQGNHYSLCAAMTM